MAVFDWKHLLITGLIAVAVLGAIVGLMATPLGGYVQQALNNIGSAITDFIFYLGPYIKFGRRLLNNFVFAGFEWVIGAVFWISVSTWLIKFTLTIAFRIFRSTATD